MLHALTHRARTAATYTAQTAVLGLVASLMLTVGSGFMTLAAWLLLVTVTTAVNAATIIGCAYLGVALILLASISIKNRNHRRDKPVYSPHQPKQGDDIVNQVVLTFLAGIAAGRKARS